MLGADDFGHEIREGVDHVADDGEVAQVAGGHALELVERPPEPPQTEGAVEPQDPVLVSQHVAVARRFEADGRGVVELGQRIERHLADQLAREIVDEQAVAPRLDQQQVVFVVGPGGRRRP